ncbi:nuclear transport factor 2 family protein [Rhizobium sp. PAMB 3182]
MSSQPSFDPVENLKRFHAAINALDFDVIDACFADDVVYLSGGTGNVEGKVNVMTAFRRYFNAYPDQVAENDAVYRLSDRSAKSVWRLRATHSVTGAPLVRRGEETIHFDENGEIIRVEVTDLGVD